MKTSKEWYNEVLQDQTKFNDWLVKQYEGELIAANRILELAMDTDSPTNYRILMEISRQELQHSLWMMDILKNRNIPVPVVDLGTDEKISSSRYWPMVEKSGHTMQEKYAVGAHAETMRLDRIRAICEHPRTATDIKEVFDRILVDELWHAKAFASMAGEEAMLKIKPDHEKAKSMLGLVP